MNVRVFLLGLTVFFFFFTETQILLKVTPVTILLNGRIHYVCFSQYWSNNMASFSVEPTTHKQPCLSSNETTNKHSNKQQLFRLKEYYLSCFKISKQATFSLL